MITVDDSGRQLTIHFGCGNIAVTSGKATGISATIGLVKLSQLVRPGKPGEHLPDGVECAGSTIVLAFHNIAGLAVVEKALRNVRRHLEEFEIKNDETKKEKP